MVNYDTRTTVFSPDGKIFQVEYAMKAVKSAGLCFALKNKDQLILFIENKISSKLLDRSHPSLNVCKSSVSSIPEKVSKIDQHFYITTAGLASDANILMDYLRRLSLDHYSQYDMPIDIGNAVSRVADYKQHLTQHGSLRPLGASLIYFGVTNEGDLVLYSSDPSGNFNKYKAVAIGNESMQIMSELDSQLNSYAASSSNAALTTNAAGEAVPSVSLEDLTVDEMLLMGMKCIMSTIGAGSNQLPKGKLEAYCVSKKLKDPTKSAEFDWQNNTDVGMNLVDIKVLTPEEIEEIVNAASTRNSSTQPSSGTSASRSAAAST
ncbi:MAG: hypothetical protein MHMPM18_001455 [Marteilia pararefringens]